MKAFSKYLEDHKEIKKYTTDIKLGYNARLNLYKADTSKIVRVNPTTVYDALGN